MSNVQAHAAHTILDRREKLAASQAQVLEEIGQKALAISKERYSSGFPDFRGGSIKKLGHNNARHNRRTGDDGARLARMMGLSAGMQELQRIAGYAHDFCQLKGRGHDERESAEWLEKHLLQTHQFPEWVAKLAAKAILGTLPLFHNGQLVDQTANHMDFATRDEELFIKTLASADLSELYTPFGPYEAHMLYVQISGKEPGETPGMSELLEFQRKQIELLDSYKYPLPEARILFATHEAETRQYARFVYRQLERGELTWARLLSQDLAFMDNPYQDFDKFRHEFAVR